MERGKQRGVGRGDEWKGEGIKGGGPELLIQN